MGPPAFFLCSRTSTMGSPLRAPKHCPDVACQCQMRPLELAMIATFCASRAVVAGRKRRAVHIPGSSPPPRRVSTPGGCQIGLHGPTLAVINWYFEGIRKSEKQCADAILVQNNIAKRANPAVVFGIEVIGRLPRGGVVHLHGAILAPGGDEGAVGVEARALRAHAGLHLQQERGGRRRGGHGRVGDLPGLGARSGGGAPRAFAYGKHRARRCVVK
jgi:hypothetical protein